MSVLPYTRPAATFKLDPLLVTPAVGDSGGVLVQDTLLRCVTRDNSKLESTLEFTLSLADTKSLELDPEMVVRFKDRTYKIRTLNTDYDVTAGRTRIEAYCERLWYDLLTIKEVPARDYTGAYANTVVANLLAGTGWTAGTIESSRGVSFSLTEGTALSALQDLAAIFELWLVIDDRTKSVHLVTDPGRDLGVYFDYERGITKATKKVDTSNLVTRIYGKNADGQTIAPANGGVPYVENFDWTPDIRVMTYNFRSGMSPATMLRYLRGYLKTRSRPTITYEYTVGGLNHRIQDVDRFEVFDKVTVLDRELGTPSKHMVTGFIVDWLDLSKSRLTLGPTRPSLASSTALAATSESTEAKFTQTKNLAEVVIPSSPDFTQVLLLDFTTSSEAPLQVGSSLRVNTTVATGVVSHLSGYFLLDGERMSEEIEYTATESGWVTVGVPALVEGLQAGQHTLSLWLRMNPGAGVVPVMGAALWVGSTGVVGGGSTNPDRGVLDAVNSWLIFTPTDSVTVSIEQVTRRVVSEGVPAWLGFTVEDSGALAEFKPDISVSGSVVTFTGMLPFQPTRVRVTDTPAGAVEALFNADEFGVWEEDLGALFELPVGTWSGLEVPFSQAFSITVT